jgi:hypothetical protein
MAYYDVNEYVADSLLLDNDYVVDESQATLYAVCRSWQ